MNHSVSPRWSNSSAIRPGTLISADEWEPIDIDALEPAAWSALRRQGNTAVVAGPGAGKSEFLAQKAAYLLQTGSCPWPQRILAISFKRDAAANLGQRVTARVPDHAHRFVSMTFDAFTKGLVDRFSTALPPDWELSRGYDIRFLKEREVEAFLGNVIPSGPATIRSGLARLRPSRFIPDIVGGWPLPVTVPEKDPSDVVGYAAMQWWRQNYLSGDRTAVDFTMINRLAELLVRSVPGLRRALRLTYPFVFIDEFQDTTSAQFSFLASVFANGPTVTAVGDSKQRIMGWAGALPNALAQFTTVFNAASYPLSWNFRSSPGLVDLQHVVASSLDTTTTRAISKADYDAEVEPAEMWTFSSLDREAVVIADWIAHDIAASGREPADFALLARQQIAAFERRFRDRLAEHGLKLRNDAVLCGKVSLQDLLKHQITRLLLGVLRLANQPRGLPTVWREVVASLTRIHGVAGDETGQRQVGDELSALTISLRSWLKANPPRTSAAGTVEHMLSLIDINVLRRHLRSSTPDEQLETFVEAFTARLSDVAQGNQTWTEALDQFECADAVVLLTAHRSKGLEYHTVFFLGLDDDQWWAHGRDPVESTSTFFVGLSRAAQRIIFTTTSPNARNGKIADFFHMLDQAGVPEVDHG